MSKAQPASQSWPSLPADHIYGHHRRSVQYAHVWYHNPKSGARYRHTTLCNHSMSDVPRAADLSRSDLTLCWNCQQKLKTLAPAPVDDTPALVELDQPALDLAELDDDPPADQFVFSPSPDELDDQPALAEDPALDQQPAVLDDAPALVEHQAIAGDVLMSQAEARATADQIRTGIDQLRQLVDDFNQREGWRALGFDSFRSWAMAELPDTSIRHIYRLLRAADVDRSLGVPIGHTPESHARALDGVAPDQRASVLEHADQLAAGQPRQAKHIARAIDMRELVERAEALGAIVNPIPDASGFYDVTPPGGLIGVRRNAAQLVAGVEIWQAEVERRARAANAPARSSTPVLDASSAPPVDCQARADALGLKLSGLASGWRAYWPERINTSATCADADDLRWYLRGDAIREAAERRAAGLRALPGVEFGQRATYDDYFATARLVSNLAAAETIGDGEPIGALVAELNDELSQLLDGPMFDASFEALQRRVSALIGRSTRAPAPVVEQPAEQQLVEQPDWLNVALSALRTITLHGYPHNPKERRMLLPAARELVAALEALEHQKAAA